VISAGHLTVASLDAQTVVVSATAAALDGSAAGARIVSLTPGGAADRAGLKVGDVITQLDDQKLGDQFPLAELLHTRFKPQQKVTVSFTRGSSSGQVQLTLIEERPACA
jgi:putative serine protease PepD